jgi:hypothetical protein
MKDNRCKYKVRILHHLSFISVNSVSSVVKKTSSNCSCDSALTISHLAAPEYRASMDRVCYRARPPGPIPLPPE